MNPYIKYFDVSMRDGLQSLSKIYSLQEKQIMLNKIMKKYIVYLILIILAYLLHSANNLIP